MYKKIICALALMFVVSTSGFASHTEAKLELLSGCWRGVFDDTTIEERWDNLKGGLMLGTAKTVTSDMAVEFEFLKIQVSQTETLYTPYINGVAADPFKLTDAESSATKLVFENPVNPFPKKIVYTKSGSSLEIALLGDEGGDSVQYALASVSCN